MQIINTTLLCVALLASQSLLAQPFSPRHNAPQENVAPRELTFNPALKPFYHGVASGDPTSISVVIWTRVTPEQTGPVTVQYFVSRDLSFSNLVASGMLTATDATDYNVKTELTNLQAGTTYYYYFRANGLNSLVGRAKTCPSGGVNHLRFGVVSCSNYEGGYFNAYGTLAGRNDIDAVLHLGDYIYEYGAGTYGTNLPNRTNKPITEILTLSDYRTRYSLYRLDPDLIRMHQQHTVITVWDDHESANDSYTNGAENHQANEGSWEVRKAISKQVYFEWMPIRGNATQEIYRKFSYGSLAEILMLDTRLEGRVEPPPSFDTPDVPARSMISQTQYNWLINNLKQSQSRWKILGNQVLFSTFNVGFAGGAFDGIPDPLNIDSVRQAENVFIDNWESYPTQRNSIIDTLQLRDIDNVVIVTGDSHCSWAFDVTTKPVNYPVIPSANPYNPSTGKGYNKTGEGSWAVEFGTPSISSPNFDEAIGPALTAQFEQFMNNPIPGFNLEYNPHLKYVDLDRHGYILLDLKPDTAQANFYYVSTVLNDTLLESFGRSAFTLHTQNRLNVSTKPSAPKSVQDIATPLLPFGISSTGEEAVPVALFSIFPNPADDFILIHFGLNQTESLIFKIFDMSGKQVHRVNAQEFKNGLHQYGLQLPALNPGMYIVSIETAKGIVSSRKILIK